MYWTKKTRPDMKMAHDLKVMHRAKIIVVSRTTVGSATHLDSGEIITAQQYNELPPPLRYNYKVKLNTTTFKTEHRIPGRELHRLAMNGR